MIVPTCLKCNRVISGDEINVATDVVYCRECNVLYQLSELTHADDYTSDIDLKHPPKGAWVKNDRGVTIFGATHRKIDKSFFLILAFAIAWNAGTSTLASSVLAMTLRFLELPAPSWLAGSTMNGPEPTVSSMLYHWLFLIPFLLAGFLVAGITLWRIMERTEVRIAGKRASVCTGVGSLGRQTHFDPTQIKGIQLQGSYSGKTCETFMIKVQMHGGKHIEFGSGISSERLHYLLSAFKATIRGQEKSRHGSPPHKGHI